MKAKVKQKQNMRRMRLILACLVIFFSFGILVLAHPAKADYYQEGVVASTDLLFGISDESWITGFTATSSVPASTTLGFLFSIDNENWYNHKGEAGIWDTVASGTTYFDLRELRWATSTLATTSLEFYYKARLTSNIATHTPIVYEINLEYSTTDDYTAPDHGSYSGGIVLSTNLLDSLGDVAWVTGFRATTTIPATTSVSVLFSTDLSNWYNSGGEEGVWQSLSDGFNNINLKNLLWQDAVFYYKLKLETLEASTTPVVSEVSVDYSDTYNPPTNANGYFEDGIYVSNILGDQQAGTVEYFGYNATIPASTTAQIIFSNDSVNYYSSTGTAWQWTDLADGDYIASSSGFDLTSLNWTEDLYYKIKLTTASGTATAVINEAKAYFQPSDPVEFISIIDPDDAEGTDYTSLSLWEAAVQSDLTATSTLVFSYDADTAVGSFPDGSVLVGATSGATGTLLHLTGTSSIASQQLLVSVASGRFQKDEQVYIEGASGNYVYLANSGDFVIAVATCRGTDGSADTTAVDVDGWTTSAANYIKIWTDPTDVYGRHNGVWSDGKYRLTPSGGSSIRVYHNNVTIDGLQVNFADNGDGLSGIRNYSDNSTVDNRTISNNIIKSSSTSGSNHSGLFVPYTVTNQNIYIYNNVIYNFRTYGIDYDGNANAINVNFKNNTFYNCGSYGIYVNRSGIFLSNNIVQDSGIDYYINTGSFHASSSNNISSDGTVKGINSKSSTTVKFLDATNNDFHLHPDDTAALNAGTTTIYKYDIDGTARGASFDIGADELPVEFVSTICENTSAGGDCADLDYKTLSDWEDAVEVDLSTSTTRIFSGAITGTLNENTTVNLCDGTTDLNIDGVVVATTSDQIMIDGITGTSTPLNVASSTTWSDEACSGQVNYWTVTGTDDELGASPIAIAKIDGVWASAETDDSSVGVEIGGWETDTDNYIKVYTTSLARHNGSWDDTKYRYAMTRTDDGNYTAISVDEREVIIEGVQISLDNHGQYRTGIRINMSEDYSTSISAISNNIVKDIGSSTDSVGIQVVYINNAKVFNNIVYNASECLHSSTISGANNFYNNTVFNCDIGIATGYEETVAINNLIASTTNPFSGDFVAETTHNATDIADTPNGGSNTITNATINFISTTFGSEDFHLDITKDNSDLINAGAYLLTDIGLSGIIQTDIDGAAMNPDDLGYDIGADEIPAKQYRSVGNDATDLSNSATVTISSTTRTAIFSAAQPDNIGVGDVIQYGNSGAYKLAFIISRASSTEYGVQSWDTTAPSATTTAAMEIFRAHLELNDWEDQTVAQVNTGIDSTVETQVLVNQDLVASNTTMMVAAYASDSGDNAEVYIDDWNTSAQNYIKVYTPVDSEEVGITQRHSGIWDDDKYYIQRTSGSGDLFRIYDDFVRLEGLQALVQVHDTNNIDGIVLENTISDSAEIFVSNSIIRGEYTGTSENARAIGQNYCSSGDATRNFKAWNNIIYGFKNSVYTNIHSISLMSGWDNILYNNTIYNSYSSVTDNATRVNTLLKNNISQYSDVGFGTGFDISSDNNISDIASDAPNDTFSTAAINVKFIDESNDNFHLHPNDSVAIDNGTSTVLTDISSLNYDIDNNYRRQFDIGADEASIDFVTTIEESGNGDFSTLSAWEDGVDSDLVATTTAVFSITNDAGTFTPNNTFIGQTSNATGTLIQMGSSSDQVLLVNIQGTFISGEEISDGNGTTTLSDAGNPANAVAKIDGVWSSAEGNQITISDWETGPNNRIRIYTTDTARHQGVWDDNKYRMEFAGYGYLLTRESYVVMDGLQLSSSGSENISVINLSNSDDYGVQGCVISNNILNGTSHTIGSYNGIYFNNDAGYINQNNYVINNIVYGFNRGIVIDSATAYINYAYNNTVYDNDDIGIYFVRNGIAKNNISQNNNTDFYSDVDFHVSSSNNISSDGTAPGVDSMTTTTVTFLDAANNDFRLSPNDTTAKDAGTSTPMNTSGDMIYDIQGTMRGASWDIGADELTTEYVSTICENSSAGGDCVDLDYQSLSQWETAVEVDLTATTTRIFSGSIGVKLDRGNAVTLRDPSGAITSITANVAATTSDQILLYNIDTGNASSASAVIVNGQLLSVASGSVWERHSSSYWTVAGTNDELGASPIAIAKIDGAWSGAESGQVTVDSTNWETDTDNYIKIYTTDAARHNGSWNNTKYRIESSEARTLSVNTNNVTIDGLQLFNNLVGESYPVVLSTSAESGDLAEFYILNNIIRADYSGITSGYGVGIGSGDNEYGKRYIYNNIVYGMNGASDDAMYLRSYDNYVYNNTIYDSNYGIAQSSVGTVLAINNLVASTTNPFYATFHASSTNNATDIDDTPEGASNTLINQTFSFVSLVSGSEDFHLSPTDTGAKDFGADLSADTNQKVISDIDGQGRIASFDIGADETAIQIFRSVGPSNTTALDTGASGVLTISDLTATFAVAVPDNVGVGDAIEYDSDDDGTVDALAFIHKRISSTVFNVLTASGTPPTVTTVDTDWNIFRAYTSLDSAEDGTENTGITASLRNFDSWSGGKDLLAYNQQWNIACYGDAVDTTAVVIDGWTTGEQNYIKVYTPVDSDEVGETQRHSGKWDDDKYNLIYTADGNYTRAIRVEDLNVKIDGLQIGLIAGAYINPNGIKVLADAPDIIDYTFSNNILKQISGTAPVSMGIGGDSSNTPAGTMNIYNNIIYDFSYGIVSYVTGETNIYNNTLSGNTTGITRSQGTVIVKNNIVQDSSTAYNGTFSADSGNNISNQSDAPGSDSQNNVVVKFVDAINKDFHLAPDSPGIDQGTSTVSSLFTTDIDGNLITTYDIGADDASIEFISMVEESGSGDNYTTLASWEAANQVDLTATSTRAYDITGLVGTVGDGATVVGASSNATGTVVHVSTTTNQVLLQNITGSFTDDEQLQVDGSNYVTISNLGNMAISVARINGAWSSEDTTTLAITGWTTGEYNYVKVYTTDTARHNSKWDDSKYVLSLTNAYSIDISESYSRIDGLQIENIATDGNTNRRGILIRVGQGFISNNILRATITNSSGANGIDEWNIGGSKIWNNIVYDFTNCIQTYASEFDTYVYNNTVSNCSAYGVYRTGAQDTTVINNIAQNCGIDFHTSFHPNSSNNISSDTTAPGTNSKINSTVSFVDTTNYDFHLALGDAVARNAGIDLSNDATSSFYMDIDGTSRGGAWDIGADEAATEFVSTIMEPGGDYNSLSTWEADVNTNLIASGTLVYSGSITGTISSGDAITLYRSGTSENIHALVVATTSSQLLIENASTTDYNNFASFIAQSGDEWRVDASNLWTVSGSGDQLGAPVISVAKIDGAWSGADTTAVIVDGWSTGPGNYIKVYTTETARHQGVWNDNKYRLEYAGDLIIEEDYVELIGLQIDETANSGAWVVVQYNGTGKFKMGSNIIRSTGGGSSAPRGVVANGSLYAYNNILYDLYRGFDTDDCDSYLYNNTVYNVEESAFRMQNNKSILINNIANNCTNNCYAIFQGGWSGLSNYNISDDGTAPGSVSSVSATVLFISTTTKNLHLAKEDTAARNKGVNLTSDTNLAITTDIDGEERPWPTGGSFDIGADQYHGSNVSMGGAVDSSIDLDNGLVGHWTFNELSGLTVFDKSGNGNDGTWSGSGEHWEDVGRFGSAGEFNGSDDVVTVSESTSLNNLDIVAFSAWVYLDADGDFYYDRILDKSGGIDEGFTFYAHSSLYYFEASRWGTYGTWAFGSIVSERWVHLAVTYDYGSVNNNPVCYVDGKRMVVLETQTPAGSLSDYSHDLKIGNHPALTRLFDGNIDEVRIYNRAISQREIAELYNNGKSATEWHFRNNLQDTGTSCELGNCKNLTGSGNIKYETGYLEEGTTALSLDGASYASLADDDYFDIASTSDFSVLATVKTTSANSQGILTKKSCAGAICKGWSFGLDNGHGDGVPVFEFADSDDNEFEIYGNQSIADGKWHTIIGVFDEDDVSNCHIYIDGTKATGAASGTLSVMGDLGTVAPIRIGELGSGNQFVGSIDRVAFFPYAMTRNDMLRENANSYSVQIGQQTKNTSTGVAYDPFGGAAPVAHWKLDEMSGATAKDYASSSLDGTWNGTGNHFKNGKVGMGGNFNGSDDRISGFDFNGDQSNTFEFWTKSANPREGYVILGNGSANNNNVGFFDAEMRYRVNDGSSVSVAFNGNIYQWNHFSYVRSGTTITFYQNGINIGSGDIGTASDVSINQIGAGGNTYFYSGQIDDVKIYDYARAPAQIAWDYNRGKPIAHWKFDEASSGDADGASLIDSSGNGNVGTGSSTGSGLSYASGKFGNTLDFDGSDDFVSGVVMNDYGASDRFTIAAWILSDSHDGFDGFIMEYGGSCFQDLFINFDSSGNNMRNCINNNTCAVSSRIWVDNVWTHVIATYDSSLSSDNITIYENATLTGTADYATTGNFDGIINIGNSPNCDTINWDGKIDDVRIYNYVLPDSMIKEVYNGGRVRFGE